MKFPNRWLVPKNLLEEGQIIPFNISEDDFKGMSFVSEIENTKIEKTIAKIKKIINYNKEKEQKEQLFKEYVDRLKLTFEKNNLEKLQNLQFEFENNSHDILNNSKYDEESEVAELVGEGEKEG